jgi:hypothetical protein
MLPDLQNKNIIIYKTRKKGILPLNLTIWQPWKPLTHTFFGGQVAF